MSGRKASEVNQLLRNGKNARSGAIDMINSSYKNFKDSAEETISEIQNAKSVLEEMDFDISTAEREFPDAANRIKNEMAELKSKISGLAEPSDVHTLKEEFKELNKKYEENDRKAEDIGNIIKRKINTQGGDPWYCDNEYRAANKVSMEYAVLKKNANELNNKLSTNVNSLRQLSAKAGKLAEQSERLVSQGKMLEEKARQAVQLRADAGKARESVISDLNAIDAEIARKFLPAEYAALIENINTFKTLSDSETVEKFSEFTSAVKNFSTELDKIHSEFLRKQGEVKALLESVEHRLGEKIFSDPMNDFKPGEHEKMNIVNFLKGFCAGKYTDDISSGLEKAKNIFKSEQFDDAKSILTSLSETLNSASEYAAAQHERQKVQLENTLAIRETMLKMNYDVSAKINKNADGVVESYDVICRAGDEEIIFENIAVDDDGKFGFGIDHTESTTGHCGKSWREIRSALAEDNIFIEDITKNGKSVIYSNKTAASAKTTNERLRG